MARTVAELEEIRTALEDARFSGTLRASVGGDEGSYDTTFKSDAEMEAALQAITRKINEMSRPKLTSTVRFSTSKGL